jgi:hypothetical protein
MGFEDWTARFLKSGFLFRLKAFLAASNQPPSHHRVKQLKEDRAAPAPSGFHSTLFCGITIQSGWFFAVLTGATGARADKKCYSPWIGLTALLQLSARRD